MDNEILYLLAGVAAVMLLAKKTTTTSSTGTATAPQAIPVAVSNGWQYFTDGTAISPAGEYYYKGELVYSPPI